MPDAITIIGSVVGVGGLILAVIVAIDCQGMQHTVRRKQYADSFHWSQIEKDAFLGCSPCIEKRQSHIHFHNPGASGCWQWTLLGFFDTQVREQSKVARKQLPLALYNKHLYLETDSETLLAFLLLVSPVKSNLHHWLQADRRKDNLSVYHLSADVSLVKDGRDLTKPEVNALLKGYPPWYRAKLKTVYDTIVDHPLRPLNENGNPDSTGLGRGGWVVALGFTKMVMNLGVKVHPRAFFYVTPTPMRPDISVNRTIFSDGTEWVEKVLEEILRPNFGDVKAVVEASENIGQMNEMGGQNIRQYTEEPCMNLFHQVTEYTGDVLDHKELEFGMSIFNLCRRLTEDERSRLRRNEKLLLALCKAAEIGVGAVHHYVQYWLHEQELAVKELQDIKGSIWLRDCFQVKKTGW